MDRAVRPRPTPPPPPFAGWPGTETFLLNYEHDRALEGIGMQQVTVYKDKLIDKLQENLAGHRAIYEEALVGYKEVALAKLEEYAEQVRGGEIEVIQLILDKPSDHSKEYERIIAMAEASVDSKLTLSQAEFRQYWLDDWGWRREFLASNAAYSATASTMLAN